MAKVLRNFSGCWPKENTAYVLRIILTIVGCSTKAVFIITISSIFSITSFKISVGINSDFSASIVLLIFIVFGITVTSSSSNNPLSMIFLIILDCLVNLAILNLQLKM
jgi:hypothetical protein